MRLTVTNDQGGTDDAIASIIVNGAPTINISMPNSVRAGDAALLDASASFDPEGDELAYAWDLNAAEDSDGDGDPTNDADETTPTVLVDTTTSGLILGMLRVDDAAGAFAVQPFAPLESASDRLQAKPEGQRWCPKRQCTRTAW